MENLKQMTANEIVKALRDYAIRSECGYGIGQTDYDTVMAAADLIEQQQAEIEQLKAVRLVRCIQADEPFEVGKLYPVCGDNDGVHVIGVTEDGEPYDLVCHNYGDELWDVMKIIDDECLGAKFAEVSA